MLSENTLDKLVQPIVNRQEAINTYVISKIAITVREIGELSPNDIKRMQLLVQYVADIREMNDEIASGFDPIICYKLEIPIHYSLTLQ